MGLTERQRAVLVEIERYLAKNGYPPSVKDLTDAGHGSGSNVLQLLARLERKGYLKRTLGRARAMRVLRSSSHRSSSSRVAAAG